MIKIMNDETPGPSPVEMGIQPDAAENQAGHYTENKSWVPGESHVGEEAINECLDTKRIGFKEIGVDTVENIVRRAPQDEIFTVPDPRYQETYGALANLMGRKDLKFVVGQ